MLADENVFPKIIGAEQGSDPATPSTGQRKLYAKSDGWYEIDDAGTITGPFGSGGGGGGGGGAILAYVAYKPGSNYTTTSSSHVQIDSTNLKVTFTAPSSGKVIVDLTDLLGGPGAIGQWVEWSLFESGSVIAGTQRQALQGGNVIISATTRHVITGLTPGSSHTYTWGWNATACTATLYASVDAAIMTVSALP